MNSIRVSVAMATYNGEAYIKQQLESIIANITEEDEIVISDDGSKDNTIDIILFYSKQCNNIKLIKGPGKGVMKNFENAISHTRGQYIFLADQDDVWLKNKVEETLALFDSDKVKAVVNDVAVIDKNQKIMLPSFFKYRKSRGGVLHNIVRNSYLGCAMCFKAEMKSRILPIPESGLMSDQWHDQWIGLLCDYYGQVCFTHKILGYYRRHGGNKSSMERGSVRQMIVNRVIITRCLIKRIKGSK